MGKVIIFVGASRVVVMNVRNISLIISPCFIGHPDRVARVQTKVKKRISVIDDMTHTCDDDSDTEINLSFNGASSITGDDDVPVANQNIGRPETASKSESILSSPIEGWDLSPDGVRTSEGLETSIAESKINAGFQEA